MSNIVTDLHYWRFAFDPTSMFMPLILAIACCVAKKYVMAAACVGWFAFSWLTWIGLDKSNPHARAEVMIGLIGYGLSVMVIVYHIIDYARTTTRNRQSTAGHGP